MAWSLGLLGAAGAPVGDSDFDLLETTVLDADTASVSFTSLNSTYGSDYKHLQIRLVGRSNRAIVNDYLECTINNVTSSASYATHALFGNGSNVDSFAVTTDAFIGLQSLPAASTGSNEFGAINIDFLDAFDTSKNKTLRSLGGYDERVSFASGLFASTNAIDTIKIEVGGGTNLLTGSRFSLYGIKAA